MSSDPFSYEHSRTFSALKRVKETLDTNLTTAQYLKTLDEYLNRALTSIVSHSSHFDGYVAQLLAWQERHPKRKVSFLSREEFRVVAMNWLMTTDRQARVQSLTTLKLDRAIIFEFCRSTLDLVRNYEEACNANLKDADGQLLTVSSMLEVKHETEKALGSSGALMSAIQSCRFWINIAEEFKNSILEKYIRLCLQRAQRDYVKIFKKRVSIDDIVMWYILATTRSIDKCDAYQGVLTTHIQNYFYTARPHINKAKPNDLNTEIDQAELKGSLLTSGSLEEDLESQQKSDSIKIICRLMDPEGYGRAYLGINESAETMADSRLSAVMHAEKAINTSKSKQ